MDSVNKTMYIPLYAKAFVSKKGLFLEDKKAEEIWQREGFDVGRKSRSKWLAYYLGMRSAVFDEWLRLQMRTYPDAVVIHVGCGLDSRIERVGAQGHLWYDVDFDEVISERKKYYLETDLYHMIVGDARDSIWLETIPSGAHVLVVMEGVSMYVPTLDMRALIESICERFDSMSMLVDVYTTLGAKMSKIKNPIKEVGVQTVYGVDSPSEYITGEVECVFVHSITPTKYVDMLKGIEKFVFRTLYAGNLSKKLYQLYEYKKEISQRYYSRDSHLDR